MTNKISILEGINLQYKGCNRSITMDELKVMLAENNVFVGKKISKKELCDLWEDVQKNGASTYLSKETKEQNAIRLKGGLMDEAKMKELVQKIKKKKNKKEPKAITPPPKPTTPLITPPKPTTPKPVTPLTPIKAPKPTTPKPVTPVAPKEQAPSSETKKLLESLGFEIKSPFELVVKTKKENISFYPYAYSKNSVKDLKKIVENLRISKKLKEDILTKLKLGLFASIEKLLKLFEDNDEYPIQEKGNGIFEMEGEFGTMVYDAKNCNQNKDKIALLSFASCLGKDFGSNKELCSYINETIKYVPFSITLPPGPCMKYKSADFKKIIKHYKIPENKDFLKKETICEIIENTILRQPENPHFYKLKINNYDYLVFYKMAPMVIFPMDPKFEMSSLASKNNLLRLKDYLYEHNMVEYGLLNVYNYELYNAIRKNLYVKKYFPDLPSPQKVLEIIPKTPDTTPVVPNQFLIHKNALQKLKSHMKETGMEKIAEKKKLIDLVPKTNVLANNKDIRMYHGTSYANWKNIKEKGILPIGAGLLGDGFYFTSSVPVATVYFKGGYDEKNPNVIVELKIKDADQLTVGEFHFGKEKEETDPIISDQDVNLATSLRGGRWQYIVRDQKIINKHFKVTRIFKLN